MLKKQLDWKDKVNFEIHDVTTWLTAKCNRHIAQYKGNQTMKLAQLLEYNNRNIFLQQIYRK